MLELRGRWARVMGLGLVVFGLLATKARAAEDSISVPGGYDALARYLGLPIAVPEERLRQVNGYLLSALDPKGDWKAVPTRVRLVGYLEGVAELREKHGAAIEVGLRDKAQRKRLDRLAGDLGYDLKERKGAVTFVPKEGVEEGQLRSLATALGWDLPALGRELEKGGSRTLELQDDTIGADPPLALWTAALGEAVPARQALRVLAEDQRLSLVIDGLARLSATTRETYRSAGLLPWIYSRAAPAFSRYAHALDLRDGRLQPPGDEGGRPLWEDLAGDPLGDLPAFVQGLLSRRSGRVAYLWQSLFFASPDRVALYLSGGAGAKEENRYLRRLLRRLDDASRVDFDAARSPDLSFASFVRSVPLDASGQRFDLPGGPGLWWGALRGDEAPRSVERSRELAQGYAKQTMDDGDLLLKVLTEEVDVGAFNRPTLPRLIRAANFFPERRDLLTPETVVFLARSTDAYPSALGVLDALDLSDPATAPAYLATVGQLASLSAGTDTEILLSLFQGGGEWLRRIALGGVAPAGAVERPLLAWSRLFSGARVPEQVAAGIGPWLQSLAEALPEPPADSPGRGPLERRLLHAVFDTDEKTDFEWEGVGYRGQRGADRARVALERMEAQSIPSADDLVGLAHGLAELEKACQEESLEQATLRISDLRRGFAGLPVVRLDGIAGDEVLRRRVLPTERERMIAGLAELGQIRKASKLDSRADDVRRWSAGLGPEFRPYLLAAGYLVAAGDRGNRVLDDPNLIRKHLLFRFLDRNLETESPWSSAAVSTEGATALGAHVRGHVSQVATAVANYSISSLSGTDTGSKDLLRLGHWFRSANEARWEGLEAAELQLLSDLLDLGDALTAAAAAEVAVGRAGVLAVAVSQRIPVARLEHAGQESSLDRIGLSERWTVALAATRGDAWGRLPAEALPPAQRAQVEALAGRKDEVAALAALQVATPWLDGRSTPGLGPWPSFEEIQFEGPVDRVFEREGLDLRLAVGRFLGRHGLPGALGRDLVGELFASGLPGLSHAYSSDWPASVRWTGSLKDELFEEALRACLRHGLYSAVSF